MEAANCTCKIERTETTTTSGSREEKTITIKHSVDAGCPEHGGGKMLPNPPVFGFSYPKISIEWPIIKKSG